MHRVLLVLMAMIISKGLFAKVELDLSYDYYLDHYSILKSVSGSDDTVIGSALLSADIVKESHSMLVSVLGTHSSASPSDIVQDLQILSNIDVQGQEGLKIFELIYSFQFSNNSLSLGWIDISKTFNTSQVGQSLINSSFATSGDFGNAGIYGPSMYPIPLFGLSFSRKFADDYNFLAVAADSPTEVEFRNTKLQSDVSFADDHYYLVAEVNKTKEQLYEFGLGLWSFKGRDSLAQDLSQSGFYTHLDYNFENGLWLFLRFGLSQKVRDRIYANLVFGVSYKPTWNDNGVFEIGHSIGKIDSKPRDEVVSEVVYEHSFKHLTAATAFQYIANPAGDQMDAQVLIFRLIFSGKL